MELDARHPELALIQFDRLVSARQYARAYALAERFVPAGSSVLDWGCGNGHMSFALDALGYVTTAYALNPPPPVAQRLPDVRFVTGSMEDPEHLPFDDGSFDAVFSIGVLEHVREVGGNEPASLREIRRVLKRGGTFICFHFPNRFSWIECIAQVVPGAHHHAYRFTRSDIRTFCEATGFDLVEARRYGAIPRNPWQALPRFVADSRAVAGLTDAADAILGVLLSPVVQNYYFVARKH